MTRARTSCSARRSIPAGRRAACHRWTTSTTTASPTTPGWRRGDDDDGRQSWRAAGRDTPDGGPAILGRRVADVGVGAAHDGPTPTAESLSDALRTALAPETRARAIAVAGTIRTDGPKVAA